MHITLREGVLLRREKRFLAYFQFSDGEESIAHCPNPGSMKGNAEPGMKIWVQDHGADHLEKGKKLRYKWVFVEAGGVKVCVDTSLANQLVHEAFREKQIPELAVYSHIKPEATLGDSRYDFLLSQESERCYVEVKSVSMGEGRAGSFPDSVTKRGQKHLLGLQKIKESGDRAVLFFLLMRIGGNSVTAAKAIDPVYAKLLAEVVKSGVEVLVYSIQWKNEILSLGGQGCLI